MTSRFSGAALVAGVVGAPVSHSLSPTLHNAWIEAAGLDAVYVPFAPPQDQFAGFIQGLRGGAILGLNVTLPFKAEAAALADRASPAVQAAQAANLLLFRKTGEIEAHNTDGEGLLYAFSRQAPDLDLASGAAAIIGAGGAARGAVATLRANGVRDIRIVNRTLEKAEALVEDCAAATAWSLDRAAEAFHGVHAIINATSAEIGTGPGLSIDLTTAAPNAVAMDMLYRPLRTAFLARAEAAGLRTVDGLDMLIGQAIPAFEALFGASPPAGVDARALLMAEMDARG